MTVKNPVPADIGALPVDLSGKRVIVLLDGQGADEFRIAFVDVLFEPRAQFPRRLEHRRTGRASVGVAKGRCYLRRPWSFLSSFSNTYHKYIIQIELNIYL